MPCRRSMSPNVQLYLYQRTPGHFHLRPRHGSSQSIFFRGAKPALRPLFVALSQPSISENPIINKSNVCIRRISHLSRSGPRKERTCQKASCTLLRQSRSCHSCRTYLDNVDAAFGLLHRTNETTRYLIHHKV
jgi:hypothetical protein